MNVKFLSAGPEIQVVEISGVIESQEGAAVRFKLDGKINEGRHKIAISLPGFQIDDAGSRESVLVLLRYCLARRVVVAISDLPPDKWALLQTAGKEQPSFFLSRQEALDFLAQAPKPKLILPYSDGPAEPEDTKPKRKTDEDLKNEALQELLKRYEVFQHPENLDPFRLEYLAQTYAAQPSYETVRAERLAQVQLNEVVAQNLVVDEGVEKLARSVKNKRTGRRLPTSEQEFNLKVEALKKQKSDLQAIHDKFEAEIKEVQEKILKLAADETTMKATLEAETKALEDKLNQDTAETKKTIADLKQRDEEEKALFDKKKAELK